MTALGDPVLDSALACIARSGWSHTRMDDIAEAAKLPLAELLRRYPSRDHLAAGVFDRMLDKLPAEFADEVDPAAPLQQRLYAAVAHELRLLEPHKAFVRELFWQLASPWSMTFFTARTLQGPLVVRYLSFIGDQIAIAQGRGEIARWVVPAVASSAFWLVHVSIIGYWIRDPSDASERTHAKADRWIANFVRTLGGPISRPAG